MNKRGAFVLVLCCLLPLLACSDSQLASSVASPSPQPTHVSSVGSLLGPPSLSAAFVDRVLEALHSPASGLGRVFYHDSVKYGIDDAFALAFFQHESGAGTTGEARVTYSIGNERCIADRPCIDRDRGGYAQMSSWSDGIDHWYFLISVLYVKQWHCTTLAQIIPRYAPNSDGNNEAAYVAAIASSVTVWRSGRVVV